MIKDLINLLNKIPMEERKCLDGVQFILEKDVVEIADGGKFVNGKCINKNIIYIYTDLIAGYDDLKKVLLHELAHHFGMNEAQVRRYFEGK